MAVMPAAGSHAPGDDDGASPSSSSSPDRGGARPHRFTPSESSNDDNGGNGRSGIVYSRGREGAGLWAGDGVLTDDGVGIEAYELRDIAVAVGRGRGSLTDGDDNDDNDDDDNDDDDDEEDEGSDDGLMDSRIVYTAEEERAVVRKFDRRLVLFVALLYMLSFLDRSSLSPLFLSFWFLLHACIFLFLGSRPCGCIIESFVPRWAENMCRWRSRCAPRNKLSKPSLSHSCKTHGPAKELTD